MTANAIRPISLVAVGNESRNSRIIAEAHKEISQNGYAYIVDVPERFSYLDFFARLGKLVPHHDGKVVWDIAPEPGMDDIYHSRNRKALVPHTEANEHAGDPPRYIALWCMKPAEDGGGATTLADGYRFLDTFDPSQMEILRGREYEWHSTRGLQRQNVHFVASHPIVEDTHGGYLLRYSNKNVVAPDSDDAFLAPFLERGMRFFDDEHVAIKIEKNGILVWDNWRMLHARTEFRDPHRRLCRVLIDDDTASTKHHDVGLSRARDPRRRGRGANARRAATRP